MFSLTRRTISARIAAARSGWLLIQAGEQRLQRAEAALDADLHVLRAQGGRVHRGAPEPEAGDPVAQPLPHDVRVAPERRRRGDRRTRRQRRHVPPHELEQLPRDVFGRPGGEGDAPAGFQDAQHLGRRDLGPGREHVAELAQYDVERLVGVGERLGVPLDELDLDARDGRVLPRPLQKDGRQVDPFGAGTGARRRDGDHARAAADVEHGLAPLDSGERDEVPRRERREALVRPEAGPHLPLAGLKLVERLRLFDGPIFCDGFVFCDGTVHVCFPHGLV